MSHADRQYKVSEGTADDVEELEVLQARLEVLDQALFDTLAQRIELSATIATLRSGEPPLVAEVEARVTSHASKAGLEIEAARQVYDAVLMASRARQATASSAPEPKATQTLLARTARRIDHVAIAVPDLETAIRTLQETCGFQIVERRRVEGEVSGMVSATMRAGGVTLVICQGTSPRSNVSRYIEAYGPGVQHLAIEVDDVPAVIAELKARGAGLLTDVIHGPGLDQAFTLREKTSGMQFEFVARTGNRGFDDDNVRKLFTAMEQDDVY